MLNKNETNLLQNKTKYHHEHNGNAHDTHTTTKKTEQTEPEPGQNKTKRTEYCALEHNQTSTTQRTHINKETYM